MAVELVRGLQLNCTVDTSCCSAVFVFMSYPRPRIYFSRDLLNISNNLVLH